MKKFLIFIGIWVSVCAFGQHPDKKDVRQGNRQFRKEKFADADLSYRHALNVDSTSVTAAYNLANALYREGDMDGAGKAYQQAIRHIGEIRSPRRQNEAAFRTSFNAGDAALQQKQYRSAMQLFAEALMVDPDDLEAKENYIYARKMLENNPDGGGGGNDQDQDQDQDQNQDKDQDQDKDQNQDQNQDQQKQQPSPGQEITPQQAQRLLQAIQTQEKKTQEKVDAKKAEAAQSRKKEKNW